MSRFTSQKPKGSNFEVEGKENGTVNPVYSNSSYPTALEPPLLPVRVSSAELRTHLRFVSQTSRTPNLRKPPRFVISHFNAAEDTKGAPPPTRFPREPPARPSLPRCRWR